MRILHPLLIQPSLPKSNSCPSRGARALQLHVSATAQKWAKLLFLSPFAIRSCSLPEMFDARLIAIGFLEHVFPPEAWYNVYVSVKAASPIEL